MKNLHKIIWLESIDSTNNYIREHISELDNLSVIAAKSQTQGRGQRGNTWTSEPGANLTFSLILKFGEEVSPVSAHNMFIISQITALSILDLLSDKGVKAKIKWPNDIYVEDKKICGILIENKLSGKELENSIVGVGLNVNQSKFVGDYRVKPSSIINETGQHEDLNDLLRTYLKHFYKYIPDINTNSGLKKIRKKYKELLYRKDQGGEFVLMASEKHFWGIIRDVSDRGMLCVEINEGEIVEFAFNEIKYII